MKIQACGEWFSVVDELTEFVDEPLQAALS